MATHINLFIYDRFFDAFAKLPQAVQKKTREFMKKFRENPYSNAINYEKINTFKDPNLRTVRIDQTYRAIIHAPKEGSNFHLLWVDNHDEAMDWAKNKVFEWNRETQASQVFEIEEKSFTKENASTKVDNASFLSAFSNEQLLKIGIPESYLETVKTINDIDDLEKYQPLLPVDAFDNLFYLLDGLSIQSIIEEIEEGTNKDEASGLSVNSQRNFVLIDNDDKLDELLSGDFAKWKIFLHPSQNIVAYSNFKGTVKVSGGAGTGKTIAALHRLKFLSRNIKQGDKPIFFTTYTKSLVNNIEQSVNDLGINRENVIIKNLHAYAIDFAKQKNIISANTRIIFENQEKELWQTALDLNASTFDEYFFHEEYNDVILFNNVKTLDEYLRTARVGRTQRIGRQDKIDIWTNIERYKELKNKENKLSLNELIVLLSDFLEQNPDAKPFSHVICDELQDLSNIELRFIRNLTPAGENDLFLVGDPLQNIYNKQINFSKCSINIRGKRSKRLKVNYRTTEEIKKLAISTIKEIPFDNFDGEEESKNGYISLMHGDKPVYMIFDSKEEECQYVINYIKSAIAEKAIRLNEICIAARTHQNLDSIKNHLYQSNITYTYLSGEPDQKIDNNLIISTFHNTKGLEFKFMILIGVDKENTPYKPPYFMGLDEIHQKTYIKSETSLLYVAISRAIGNLLITGTGMKSNIVKI
jgi:DNA helicase IV